MLKFCFEYPKKLKKAINRRQVDGVGGEGGPSPQTTYHNQSFTASK